MLIAYQLKDDNFTIKNFLNSFKDKVSFIVNVGITFGLLIYIYLPFFNQVANTSPLAMKWWLFIIIIVLIAILPFDILKLFKKKDGSNK